jgi:hypothetical protein
MPSYLKVRRIEIGCVPANVNYFVTKATPTYACVSVLAANIYPISTIFYYEIG